MNLSQRLMIATGKDLDDIGEDHIRRKRGESDRSYRDRIVDCIWMSKRQTMKDRRYEE